MIIRGLLLEREVRPLVVVDEQVEEIASGGRAVEERVDSARVAADLLVALAAALEADEAELEPLDADEVAEALLLPVPPAASLRGVR